MENIAPEITRQRLLIEGFYSGDIGENRVRVFLTGLAGHLNLRYYGNPIVHAPGGSGKDENEGYDAFLPLIDSGISLYVWTKAQFFACVLFTCKKFSSDKALAFTHECLSVRKIVSKEF